MTLPRQGRPDEAVPLGSAPFQVQAHITCLECGGSADDEFCAGPYLYHIVVEFNKDNFRDEPLDLGYISFKPEHLKSMPYVEDCEGTEIPDHPILKALRGEASG